MNKKTIKLIYKLRFDVVKDRKIKAVLKNKYNINVTLPNINKIITLINYDKRKYTGFIERLMLKMYQDFYDTDKVVNYLNNKYNIKLTNSALTCYASSKKIKKKNINRYNTSYIKRNDEKDIIELYRQGKTSVELAKIYGYKDKKSILDKLNKHNESRRTSNQLRQESKTYKNFSFEKIDSKEKAYIIGLLITDGYINKDRNYVGIDLTDKDAIEFMSKFINVKYIVTLPKGKAKLNKYRIIIYGKDYVEQLKRFGVISKKTFTTEGCNLYNDEHKYTPYLLRGIIDGDGWIRKDGQEFFISTASKKFADWCVEVMKDIGFIEIKANFIENKENGIYLIRTALKSNIKVLKEKIYNEPLGMSRKFDRLHREDVQRL